MYTRVDIASRRIADMDPAKSLSRTPSPAGRKAAPDRQAREREIDALYGELHRLMAESPDASALAPKLDRLRRLQRDEAEEMRRRFEASLSLAPGSGLAVLQEARRLLGRDEDPSSANTALRKPG